MKKDDSSFLQGVESRLDSLFSDDFEVEKAKKDEATRPELSVKEETPDNPPLEETLQETPVDEDSVFQEITSEVKKDIDLDLKEASPVGAPSEKSAFISEIEKRFSAIFGEEIEEQPADTSAPAKPQVIPISVAAAAGAVRSAEKPVEEPPAPTSETDLLFEETASPNAVLSSPLKNIKSIVLSIEWEISEEILEQFEEELNKLYLLYTGDKAILGFLRILRFLGRYVRVRGANSNQESINLLLSVYDHFENVMVAPDMTEVKKHLVLLDNVKKYRAWAETTDLETQAPDHAGDDTYPEVHLPRQEEPIPADLPTVESEPAEAEVPEIEALEIAGDSIKPVSELMQTTKPVTFGADEPADQVEETIKPPEEEPPSTALFDIEEPLVLEKSQPVEEPFEEPVEEPVAQEGLKSTVDAMRELAPQEAFAYALEELKKTFSEDIRRMQQDIQELKDALKSEREY